MQESWDFFVAVKGKVTCVCVRCMLRVTVVKTVIVAPQWTGNYWLMSHRVWLVSFHLTGGRFRPVTFQASLRLPDGYTESSASFTWTLFTVVFFLPGVMTAASAPSFSVSALMCLSSMSIVQGPCQLTSLPLVCFCRVSSSSTIRARVQLLFSEFQALGHVRLTHPIAVFSKLPLVLHLPFSQSPLTFLFWPPLSLLPLCSFSFAWFF